MLDVYVVCVRVYVCVCVFVCAYACVCVFCYVQNTFLLLLGDEDHPQYVEPPVIPGHEFFGEVVKLGKGLLQTFNQNVMYFY